MSDVIIERTIDAPRQLVWQMFTDADHFAAWYGPQGASIPVAEMDVTLGGKRLICMEMTTPDGPMQMWFCGEYREIDEPNRLVYTELMSDDQGNAMDPSTETHVVVELVDDGAGTKLTLTHVGVPADSPGAMGWTMAIDKLVARAEAS